MDEDAALNACMHRLFQSPRSVDCNTLCVFHCSILPFLIPSSIHSTQRRLLIEQSTKLGEISQLSSLVPCSVSQPPSSLFCLQEWLQGMVMNTSACVCMSVLFVHKYISGTTRAIFTKFFVHVAYGRGSVLLRQGEEIEITRGRNNFGVFFPTNSALYSIPFGTHTKMP